MAGDDAFVLQGDAFKVRGTMTPPVAAPRQKVRLHLFRDGRPLRKVRATVHRDGTFVAKIKGGQRRPHQRPRVPRGVAAARRRSAARRSPSPCCAPRSRLGDARPARAAAPEGAAQAALRRPAQRPLRRRDGPRGDGLPQGQRHGPPLRRRRAGDPPRAGRQGRRSRSATPRPATTSRPTSRARCSR